MLIAATTNLHKQAQGTAFLATVEAWVAANNTKAEKAYYATIVRAGGGDSAGVAAAAPPGIGTAGAAAANALKSASLLADSDAEEEGVGGE